MTSDSGLIQERVQNAFRAEEKARKAMRDLVDGNREDVQVVRYEVLDALDQLRSLIS